MYFARNNPRKRKKWSEDHSFFYWLGYLDSNQGITISETVVLPLDYIPMARYEYKDF